MTNPNKPDALDLESFAGAERKALDDFKAECESAGAPVKYHAESYAHNAGFQAGAGFRNRQLRTERAKTEKLEAENKALREALKKEFRWHVRRQKKDEKRGKVTKVHASRANKLRKALNVGEG